MNILEVSEKIEEMVKLQTKAYSETYALAFLICSYATCVALLNEQCLVDKEKQYINNAIEKAKLKLAEKKTIDTRTNLV